MKPITVDGGKGTVELDAEGVLQLVWKPATVLVADDVHAAMAKVNELADGAEYPMLIDITNTQMVTRQARSVFSAVRRFANCPAWFKPGESCYC